MWDAICAVGDFFIGIADAVTGLIDFAISFIEDIVYITKLTGEFVLKIPDYFTFLPAEAVALIVSIFGVVVIYKIMGREG